MVHYTVNSSILSLKTHIFYGFPGEVHLGCWTNTRKACKSLAYVLWFTSFSLILLTSRVGLFRRETHRKCGISFLVRSFTDFHRAVLFFSANRCIKRFQRTVTIWPWNSPVLVYNDHFLRMSTNVFHTSICVLMRTFWYQLGSGRQYTHALVNKVTIM